MPFCSHKTFRLCRPSASVMNLWSCADGVYQRERKKRAPQIYSYDSYLHLHTQIFYTSIKQYLIFDSLASLSKYIIFVVPEQSEKRLQPYSLLQALTAWRQSPPDLLHWIILIRTIGYLAEEKGNICFEFIYKENTYLSL